MPAPIAVDADELQQQLINEIDAKETVDTFNYATAHGLDHQAVVGAKNSLTAIKDLLTTEQLEIQDLVLTEEGLDIVNNGSHEAKVYAAVPAGGILQPDLMKAVPNANIGFSKAMQNGWIKTEKNAEGKPWITKKVDTIVDQVRVDLQDIQKKDYAKFPENHIKDLKKRKLAATLVIKSFKMGKGPAFTTKIEKPVADLTAEMLTSGEWKTLKFKDYNFNSLGVAPSGGHLHPLMKVRKEFREIFLEMGFTEMPTNNFIESSFWNFDALFQPQQHPARDSHDTFFIRDPAQTLDIPADYLQRVKDVHEKGGYGSVGYRYDWKVEEARKNVLRTHTTAVSARMLYQLAQQKTFSPVKYFSIDRVFRNETLDATHLAEFHQIEGLVADRNLTLGDLIGVIAQFFKKLGIEKLRFKPAYNPYTEPSMEVFSYHEGLKKWVEVGNSGVFRPEMLLPMGLPEDVVVIAWGLSLERPTMIKYGINNIRDLVGHKVKLEMVHTNPICRLDN
eukprot:Opistho-2@95805